MVNHWIRHLAALTQIFFDPMVYLAFLLGVIKVIKNGYTLKELLCGGAVHLKCFILMIANETVSRATPVSSNNPCFMILPYDFYWGYLISNWTDYYVISQMFLHPRELHGHAMLPLQKQLHDGTL